MDMFKEKDEHQPEFEKKLVDGREEELNELKAWLFRENIRVETEKKDLKHWTIEGPRHIDRHSVISLNHYEKPKNMVNLLNNPDAKEIGEKDEII